MNSIYKSAIFLRHSGAPQAIEQVNKVKRRKWIRIILGLLIISSWMGLSIYGLWTKKDGATPFGYDYISNPLSVILTLIGAHLLFSGLQYEFGPGRLPTCISQRIKSLVFKLTLDEEKLLIDKDLHWLELGLETTLRTLAIDVVKLEMDLSTMEIHWVSEATEANLKHYLEEEVASARRKVEELYDLALEFHLVDEGGYKRYYQAAEKFLK